MKKVLIRDITESGLHISDTISEELFEHSEEDYVRIIAPVEVKAVLRKFESTILGDIHVKTRYASFCSRSLEKLQRDWSAAFTVDYEIEEHQESLDLEDDIRQEILLQLPVRILSDAEMAKEAKEQEEELQEERPPENTHKPFAGLKDIE